MKTLKTLLLFLFLFVVQPGFACVNCNKEIRDAIFDSAFYPNLFIILSPFAVLAIVVGIISVVSVKRYKSRLVANPAQILLSPVPLTAAATVLGIGVGGFIDGIVFHQILQWHEMLSNKIPSTTYIGKSVNMFWDGIFHAFTLVCTLVGIVLLWKLFQRKDVDTSGNLLAGGLLFGWGIFNLLEGIADHQLLKLHNVREITANKEAWNLGFLAFSVVLIVVGLLVSKQRKGHDGGYSLT